MSNPTTDNNELMIDLMEELTLIELIQHIVNLAEGCDFSQVFVEQVKPYVELMARREKINERQALLLSVIVNESVNGGCFISDIVNFINCSNLDMLPYMKDIDELEQLGFIESERFVHSKKYMVTETALESIKNDKPFKHKSYKGMNLVTFLSTFYSFTQNLFRHSISHEKYYQEAERLWRDNEDLPILQRIDGLHLADNNEELLILQFCRCLMINNVAELEVRDFIFIIDEGPNRNEHAYALTHGEHELLNKNILEYCCEDGMKDTNKFRLTDKARRLLLPDYKEEKEVKSESMDIIANKDITRKALFFGDEVKKQVDRLADLLKESNYRRIRKQLKENGFRSGFSSLFYGEPGTGKTECALQLARKTGRDVMQVNISQVRSQWVGESEKNVKRIFDEYRRLVRTSKRCPILLFNEADAIISQRKRGNGSSIDKMENTMQNIILQEMENMEGILIATTNLACNMDKAFERRFIYKVEFQKPTPEARLAIWHSMMPTLKKSTLKTLSQQYAFSGGQIENIARKNMVDKILYGKDDNDLEQLEEYCRSEVIQNKNRLTPIGFTV